MELTSLVGLCAGKLEAYENEKVNIVLFFFSFRLSSFLLLNAAFFFLFLSSSLSLSVSAGSDPSRAASGDDPAGTT